MEESSRAVMARGDGVMLRGWPYMVKLLNDPKN
jgi:hypothetical protein